MHNRDNQADRIVLEAVTMFTDYFGTVLLPKQSAATPYPVKVVFYSNGSVDAFPLPLSQSQSQSTEDN